MRYTTTELDTPALVRPLRRAKPNVTDLPLVAGGNCGALAY